MSQDTSCQSVVSAVEAETQTSDQRIILSKALLIAQTRAKEYQHTLDHYDARLVEAVADALEKVEDPVFQQQVCEIIGIGQLSELEHLRHVTSHGSLRHAATETALSSMTSHRRSLSPQPHSRNTADLSSEAHAAAVADVPAADEFLAATTHHGDAEEKHRVDRARVLQQLDLLRTHSRAWVEEQRRKADAETAAAAAATAAASAAFASTASPSLAAMQSQRAATQRSPSSPLRMSPTAELPSPASPAASAAAYAGRRPSTATGAGVLLSNSGDGMRYTRQMLGLAARAALAQRRAEIETERARAAEKRVRELEVRLAGLEARSRGSTSGKASVAPAVVCRTGGVYSDTLHRALSYLSSLCGWLVDVCSHITARVLRTFVV